MEILLGIIFGFIVGYLVINHSIKKKIVGSLVINLTNAMNDQSFLLELNTGINTVYNSDYIVLKVTRE